VASGSLKKRQPTTDDRRPFLNLSWTQIQEKDFEEWVASPTVDIAVDAALARLLGDGLSVKFSMYQNSWCVTLEDPARKDRDIPYLLTGWSDDWRDALHVALFKHYVLLEGDWNHPFASPLQSRRR
jgi:hypothetical protein